MKLTLLITSLLLLASPIPCIASTFEKSVRTAEGVIKHQFKNNSPYPAQNKLAKVALVNLLTNKNNSATALWVFTIQSEKKINNIRISEISSDIASEIPINEGWREYPFYHAQGKELTISTKNFPHLFNEDDSLLVFKFSIAFTDNTNTTLYQPWVLNQASKTFILKPLHQ